MVDKEKTESSNKKKPLFIVALEDKWVKWTGIEDEEVFEAIDDFSGELFLEMRKLTAKLCTEIEAQKISDEFKTFAKEQIDEAWRNIIDHQKIGLDKLCIVVKRHINSK